MLFNSFHFVFFFAIVLAVAMAIRRRIAARNIFLLVASYYFYGCWDARFLILIVISTMIDYCAGFGVAGVRLSWTRRIAISAGLLGAAAFCLGPDWDALVNLRGLRYSGHTLEILACAALAVLWPAIFELFFEIGGEGPRGGRAKLFLIASLISNLGILGYFKYCDFFIQSFIELSESIGWSANATLLRIVLPVGISFYTFQTLSYTIDLYRRKMSLERSFLNFALFVAFFPQLVAGPIERASHLLPQCRTVRPLTSWHLHTGFYLVCWGLFKKTVIADNVAKVADSVFGAFAGETVPQDAGITAYFGVVAFAIQIYCDFSGYTDIARGSARMMGFDLMRNFNLPYFATNPSDFWRRWHISLSTWLRDYLYIPLGGNRKQPRFTWLHLLLPVILVGWLWPWGPAVMDDERLRTGIWIASGALSAVYVIYLIAHRGIYNNLMLTMLLGGLWHGAAWTFVLWGLFHGLLLMVHRLAQPLLESRLNFSHAPVLRALWRIGCIIFFFQLTLYGWLLFRSRSLDQLRAMTVSIFTEPGTDTALMGERGGMILAASAITLFLVQLIQYLSKDLMVIFRLPWWIRGVVYAGFILGFILFGEFGETPFIYFQF